MNSEKAAEAPAAPAAGAEASSGGNTGSGKLRRIKLVEGRYYPLTWGNTRVGTPYLAEIVGADLKYGFARRFIRAAVIERRNATYLVDVADLHVGSYYEERCPCSWRHPDERYYYRITNIDLNNGEVTIEILQKKDVAFAFRESYLDQLFGSDAPIWSGGSAV